MISRSQLGGLRDEGALSPYESLFIYLNHHLYLTVKTDFICVNVSFLVDSAFVSTLTTDYLYFHLQRVNPLLIIIPVKKP